MEQVRPIPENPKKTDVAWTICDYFRVEHELEVEVGPAEHVDDHWYFPVSDTDSDDEWQFSVVCADANGSPSPEEYREWVEETVDTAVTDE